jgi:glycosyltransferase involved in cell wall biosynthesis
MPVVPEPEPESAVYIGRLEPDTGIEAYVEAVQLLGCGRCRSFRFDVFGEGSLGDRLKKRVRRDGLNVRFRGSTPDAQERVVNACFAFLDGRMAIQEAMARRRLVFAAYNNPLKHDYLCGERFSRHLIAVQSAQELADRVSYFADHSRERQERTTRAFEYARGLTWERTAEAFMRLWEERLGSPVASHSLWTRAKWTWALSQEALPA